MKTRQIIEISLLEVFQRIRLDITLNQVCIICCKNLHEYDYSCMHDSYKGKEEVYTL